MVGFYKRYVGRQMRVSPALFNTDHDIDRFLAAAKGHRGVARSFLEGRTYPCGAPTPCGSISRS
jgi:hypothetical protein